MKVMSIKRRMRMIKRLIMEMRIIREMITGTRMIMIP